MGQRDYTKEDIHMLMYKDEIKVKNAWHVFIDIQAHVAIPADLDKTLQATIQAQKAGKEDNLKAIIPRNDGKGCHGNSGILTGLINPIFYIHNLFNCDVVCNN